MSTVHQVVTGAGPYDAVSEQMRAWRRLLAKAGHGGGDFAGQIDHGAREHFELLERLEPAPEDLIVIRYSAWSPGLARLLERAQRKLLVYHNITPPGYLWNHSPGLAVQCAVGRMQMPAFARASRVVTADSHFSAEELRAAAGDRVRVVPILFDPGRLAERGAAPEGDGPLVIVVGRLVPNKRHDRVFAAFAAYQRECEPAARLLCVGTALTPSYAKLMASLVEASGARNVTLTGGLPQDEVNAAYAEASVLLTLSEHEGFCVPLLEAFHFGVPVVAAPAGAVPGVAADGALYTDGDVAVTAELLDLAVRDSQLRDELVSRGRHRLEDFSYARTAATVHDAVSSALA
ncbi:MAG: glycosyltransferase [Thermoleophilaceae bacterium]|nr:glycosyltransferase [Thermoleophilaceae bacterium]